MYGGSDAALANATVGTSNSVTALVFRATLASMHMATPAWASMQVRNTSAEIVKVLLIQPLIMIACHAGMVSLPYDKNPRKPVISREAHVEDANTSDAASPIRVYVAFSVIGGDTESIVAS